MAKNVTKINSYRGITWKSDRELSLKLGRVCNFVNYHKNKGRSYQEIINMVLDGKSNTKCKETRSYRGVTWNNDADLSKKINRSPAFVNMYIHRGKTYEQIIDMVLFKQKNYKGISWKSDRELSLKLHKSASYIYKCKRAGKTYEDIIDLASSKQTNKINMEANKMNKIVARFEKVSLEEFKNAWLKHHNQLGYSNSNIEELYNNIKLPQRSTKRSSGYDFFYPGIECFIENGTSITIPTGIRCVFLEDGYDLSIYPRSGMGFKYRLHLDNTVGIIDNDYFEANNEGHIMIRLSCDSRLGDGVNLYHGDKFAQGIIREFFLAEGDDEVEKNNRDGGMGSTGV